MKSILSEKQKMGWDKILSESDKGSHLKDRQQL